MKRERERRRKRERETEKTTFLNDHLPTDFILSIYIVIHALHPNSLSFSISVCVCVYDVSAISQSTACVQSNALTFYLIHHTMAKSYQLNHICSETLHCMNHTKTHTCTQYFRLLAEFFCVSTFVCVCAAAHLYKFFVFYI